MSLMKKLDEIKARYEGGASVSEMLGCVPNLEQALREAYEIISMIKDVRGKMKMVPVLEAYEWLEKWDGSNTEILTKANIDLAKLTSGMLAGKELKVHPEISDLADKIIREEVEDDRTDAEG